MNSVEHLNERDVRPALLRLCRDHGFELRSCLDIGAGRTRFDRWFPRFKASVPPARYVALEADGEIIDELRSEGVDARLAGEAGECSSDLTLCLEVIEHLTPEETPEFMSFVAENTQTVMALTTPNFEYYNGVRHKPEYRACRYIADHLPDFKPRGGPHTHKQAMTAENLSGYLERAFPRDTWRFQVYRAWPWRIQDLSNNAEFEFYFKLFALAWRADGG